MISASKTTFSDFNLKILRPKVTKNLTNFRKKFCEFPPRDLKKRMCVDKGPLESNRPTEFFVRLLV